MDACRTNEWLITKGGKNEKDSRRRDRYKYYKTEGGGDRRRGSEKGAGATRAAEQTTRSGEVEMKRGGVCEGVGVCVVFSLVRFHPWL